MTKLRRRRHRAQVELAQSILIYMEVNLPRFVHPHQLARRYGVSIGAARHALHLLNLQGHVVQTFRPFARGGWERHAFERRH